MDFVAKVDEQGRITLPVEIRDFAELKKGDLVQLTFHGKVKRADVPETKLE